MKYKHEKKFNNKHANISIIYLLNGSPFLKLRKPINIKHIDMVVEGNSKMPIKRKQKKIAKMYNRIFMDIQFL